MAAEAKNLEAISQAIDQHNAGCPFPAAEVRMNPFEVERLGWDEIRGLPIVPDPDIGTGRFRLREAELPRFTTAPAAWLKHAPFRLPLLQAIFALRSTVTDGEMLTLRLLQALGRSPAPAEIDSEVGRMEGGGISDAPLFTLLRYDLDFDIMARDGTISAAEAVSESTSTTSGAPDSASPGLARRS